MEAITIPYVRIPSINIGGICLPGIGAPGSIGKKGLIWPAGMKEHIKAWYDPKKQGMTNYDVIEAYVEDFTNWYKEINNGTVTATNKSFHFTEVKKIGSTNAIVRLVSHRINGEIKLNIKGVTEDNPISFTEYSTTVLTVNKDGVYTLVINDATVGIYFTKVGVVDVTVTQLPTSILKDLSGNGNHAYLYGGKGKLNSGMGVYKFDFLSDLRINSAYIPYSDRQEDKICSLIEHPAGWLFQFVSLSDIPAFKVEVKGIVNDRFVYRYYDENGNRGKEIIINKDGIYELPISYSVENNTGVGIVCSDACVDNVCFTQIPDYPDQLCYDGKMYAVCYGFPILTDYTVMAERTWFKSSPYCAFISNRDDDITENRRGAFVFEQLNNGVQGTSSFGSIPSINFVSEKISWQTKESYNGKSIGFGSNISSNPVIVVGAGVYYTNTDKVASYANLCHGTIIIADRSFTEEEINWLKQNWDKI